MPSIIRWFLLHDDKSQAKQNLKSCQTNAMISHTSLEDFSPIQYASLYGSISCKYLISLNAYTDLKVEGLNLILLSLLAKDILKKNKKNALKCFIIRKASRTKKLYR